MQDIQIARENWRRMLLVTPDEDLLDPAVQKKLAEIEKAADSALQNFHRDSTDSLFLGRMPQTSLDMVKEYTCITDLARAWGSAGTKYSGSEEVLGIIRYALEWMYEHRFGPRELEGTGWRNMRLFNWHDWELKTPQQIIRTLLILDGEMTPQDAEKYLLIFDRRVKEPRDYASNKVHFGLLLIGAGLLQEREDKIRLALDSIADTHAYVDDGTANGQGFYTDGSYIFHTHHPMNGLYGYIHYECLLELCRICRGTKFADPLLEERMYQWTENAFLPFMSKGIVTRSVLGRYPEIGHHRGKAFLAVFCEIAVWLEEDRRRRLLGDIKRNVLANPPMQKEAGMTEFCARLSREARRLFREAMADSTLLPREYSVNRVFSRMDRVIHHHGDTAFSLSMSSSRVYNYESINHTNTDGWYLGDGMLTAYAGDYYAYPGSWPQSNPYRRPGTTVDNREREPVTVAQKNEYLSAQDFVGGVTNGLSGAAAMLLESYHGDGENKNGLTCAPGGPYGGPNAKWDSTLTAHKAWFFHEKTALCLGCAISARDNAGVLTVVDSRRTQKPLVLCGKGEFPLDSSDRTLPAGTRSLYVEGFGGYWLPEEMRLTACRGGKDLSFTEIVVHHGVNPENGRYAYALLPGRTEEETAAFDQHPGVRILTNTAEVQAAAFENGPRMYVFWRAGEFDQIRVSAPAAVMLEGNTLLVSDPTQKAERIEVQIAAKTYVFDTAGTFGKTLRCRI